MIPDKDGKLLLQGILNNDKEAVDKIIGACFESAWKKEMQKGTASLMESIGNTSKIGIV